MHEYVTVRATRGGRKRTGSQRLYICVYPRWMKGKRKTLSRWKEWAAPEPVEVIPLP